MLVKLKEEPYAAREENILYTRKRKKRRTASRLRYDRIAVTALVTIFLIALMVFLVGALKKSRDKNSDTEHHFTNSELAGYGFSGAAKTDNSKAVYLSPSNQWDNPYACAMDTTEAEQMRKVAESAKGYLQQNGLTVYIAGEDITLKEKVSLANDLGVGMYVSIHSNAGGGEGTECFYNPEVIGSENLAEFVYNKVASLTPTDDRGLFDAWDTELYEMQHPTMPCCLVEVEFHDIPENAEWIVNNIDNLGKSISEGIMQYYDTLTLQESNQTQESQGTQGTQETVN